MKRAYEGATSQQIARYYDQNTRRFLRYGGSLSAGAIHRQIWAPGITRKQQALEYLNRLVELEIGSHVQLENRIVRVLDLGCGVGGTATWLASALDVEVVGITNSDVQRQLAIRRAKEVGVSNRCHFILADFLDIAHEEPFHFAYMIEAFSHAHDAAELVPVIWERLLPGGRLVIADDFCSNGSCEDGLISPAGNWLEQFQNGWQLNSLLSIAQVNNLMMQVGFRNIRDLDLTGYIRILPWYLLIPLSHITRLPISHFYWQNLKGGIALQICIRLGWTKYHFSIWEKE